VDHQEAQPDEYSVIFRCTSGARVPHERAILIQDMPTEFGPVDVVLTTEYADLGYEAPAARWLLIEVVVPATSLDEAQERAGPVAAGTAAMLAFVTNVTVATPRVHVAYDADARQDAEGLPSNARR
jgi:hypothetical protein